MRLPLAALVLLGASGCAAPYFVGQNGRVTPRGQWRAELGYGVNVATSAYDVVKDGRDAAKSIQTQGCTQDPRGCYTQASMRPVIDAAYKLALMSPYSSYSELQVRYGLFDRVDIGGHIGTGAYRLDTGIQLFGDTDALASSWAGALHLGWNKDDSGIVGDVLDIVKGDIGRNDYDVVFVAGRQFGEVGRFYVGGRYMLSAWKLEVVPDLPIVYDSGEVQQKLLGTDTSGLLHQFGGLVGGAVGWKHVFLGAELNVVRYQGKARLFFEERTMAGFAFTPSLYLYGQY